MINYFSGLKFNNLRETSGETKLPMLNKEKTESKLQRPNHMRENGKTL